MSCNTLECIAIEAAGLGWESVLQYKNCIATVEQGQGWTVLQYSGQPSHDTVGVGQKARWAGRAWGAQLGVAGVAHGRQGARQAGTGGLQARGRGAQRARQARGARGARCLGAGRAGWPWAVHSVHSACFWPGSTRYFPESKIFFGHCS